MQQQTLTSINTTGSETTDGTTNTDTETNTTTYDITEAEFSGETPPDLWFKYAGENELGERLVIGGDTYDAFKSDGLKHILDWDTCHHKWSGDNWLIDDSEDSIEHFRAEAEKRGYEVDIEHPHERDRSDERYRPNGPVADIADNVSPGDRITVRYEQKNGNGKATKRGRITQVREARAPGESTPKAARIDFERLDDSHTMWIRDDVEREVVKLITAGSRAPFVGNVIRVKIRQ